MSKLKDRVAIITGGSAGIGLGIARRFAKEGAIVAMCGRRADTLEKAAAEVAALGARVLHKVCDVTDNQQIEAFVDYVLEEAGQIDILVNNAAYMAQTCPLEENTEEEYLRSIDGGVNSVYRMMMKVFPHMKERGGKILNFSSLGGLRGVKGAGGYAAAKTAVIGLSRAAANDWGKYGININCIAPMAMSEAWADYMKTLPEGSDPWAAINVRSNALGFVGDPEEHIAPAAVFLCSDDANYITGLLMPVDGGLLDLE